MKSTSRDTVISEAASWCLCLHDAACTAQDRAAFQQWLRLDSLHAVEYEKMLEIWALSGRLPRDNAQR